MTSYLSRDARLIRTMLSDATPPEDADSLFLIYAVLLRAKGAAVTASDVHDAWAAWMEPRNRHHPALQSYDQLAPAAQQADEPYVEAIRAAAALRHGT
ncbi:MAG TPA: hypothetical protein VFX33_15985 [Actinomycetales bacterium]|nr:hypothetical protein [Actinomycetales bacterium]